MQKTFNSYKSLMLTINLSGRSFEQGDSAELRELQDALRCANLRWAQACSSLESWEEGLHSALMQCQVRRDTHTTPPIRECFMVTLGALLWVYITPHSTYM